MKVVRIKVPDSLSERDVKIATTIEALAQSTVSVGKAAEIAELPLQEFLVELKKRGVITYPYINEDASEELKL